MNGYLIRIEVVDDSEYHSPIEVVFYINKIIKKFGYKVVQWGDTDSMVGSVIMEKEYISHMLNKPDFNTEIMGELPEE